MASTTAHDVPKPQSTFPEHLPPRRYKTTWMQRHAFNWRTFFSMHYRSFSLFHLPNKRTLWRRIAMWFIQLFRLALCVVQIYYSLWQTMDMNARYAMAVVLPVLGLVLLFFTAWCLALIGDAVGTRRIIGIKVNRMRLDVFLYLMVLCHVLILVFLLVRRGPWYLAVLGSLWIALGLMIFLVALMAGKEEEHAYGLDV